MPLTWLELVVERRDMKKWKKPIITRVKLDPSQAVLAPCKVGGGAYMSSVDTTLGTAKCAYGATTYSGSANICTVSKKGGTTAGPAPSFTNSDQTDLHS